MKNKDIIKKLQKELLLAQIKIIKLEAIISSYQYKESKRQFYPDSMWLNPNEIHSHLGRQKSEHATIIITYLLPGINTHL